MKPTALGCADLPLGAETGFELSAQGPPGWWAAVLLSLELLFYSEGLTRGAWPAMWLLRWLLETGASGAVATSVKVFLQ